MRNFKPFFRVPEQRSKDDAAPAGRPAFFGSFGRPFRPSAQDQGHVHAQPGVRFRDPAFAGTELPRHRPTLTQDETRRVEDAQALLRERLMTRHARRPPPADFERYLFLKIADQPRERLVVLFLGYHGELIGEDVMFSGNRRSVALDIPEIIRSAFDRRATGVIIAHNHPSGPALPSEADTACVATLKKALAIVELDYVDDIIVARDGTYSHQRKGTL